MKKNISSVVCVSCGKSNLQKDEIGICKKLLGEDAENYYCINCLADYLNVSVEELLAKIEDFKEEGCVLFD
jgi:hypothetical protein